MTNHVRLAIYSITQGTYQELMEVFDRLKSAGVVNVGLVTRMEGQR